MRIPAFGSILNRRLKRSWSLRESWSQLWNDLGLCYTVCKATSSLMELDCVKTHCLLCAAVRLMRDEDKGTEGGRWRWWGGGQWWQHAPQQKVVVCERDQWCPTPTAKQVLLARLATGGSGTKWTVWGLSSDCMGVYIQLGHGLCVGLNSVTKRSVHEWHNAQSGWHAVQQGHSVMFYDLLANGTTLSYPRNPLGIEDPHKGTLSSRLGLSRIYPCRG